MLMYAAMIMRGDMIAGETVVEVRHSDGVADIAGGAPLVHYVTDRGGLYTLGAHETVKVLDAYAEALR